MKILLVASLLVPLSAAAEGYVEAVGAAQITGLENTYPAWSPDGARIVFESTRDRPDADIFVMQADGTGVVQLTRNEAYDGNPVWTPDGRFIVFASERDGNAEVYRMRADGSDLVNLTRHPGADGHPKVSPDGRLIYFNSNRSSDPATFSRGTSSTSPEWRQVMRSSTSLPLASTSAFAWATWWRISSMAER